MKRKLISIILSVVFIMGSIGVTPIVVQAETEFDGEEWYDQIETVEVNREPAHAFFVPYQDAATALDNEHSAFTRDFALSSYYQSLNGVWDFRWVAKPADRIDGFESPDFDTSSWDKIPVPSSWQTIRDENDMPKYDLPIYSNQRYPWRNFESVTLPSSNTSTDTVYAPLVYNPVGHYRREFTVPENWDGREVFVSFQGVDSCVYVWVNGEYVGYGEDSFTAKDFNITEYLKPGVNMIAAQVYRFSLGSFLENQDRIDVSGISRDVFLYSKDQVEIRDFFVRTTLAEEGVYDDFNIELDANVRSFGEAVPGTYKINATLKNIDNSDVWTDGPLELNATVSAEGEVMVTGKKLVDSPRQWFADTPNLYKLLIELEDPNGDVIETIVQRVGFRVIERNTYNNGAKSVMQINGKDIMLRGVNRTEFSPENGSAVTKDEIITDLKLMKQFNINAIRMSHFPNNVLTYALADELGLYVCDEANIESHEGSTGPKPIPSWITPGMNWNNSVLDRGKNMVERDKNFPSVVIWSFGNENTYTTYALNENYTFYNLSNWMHDRDPSRLRKYERDNRDGLVDIRSVQYPNPSGAASGANGTNMPYIMSEYAHGMGNSAGSIVEFWDEFRRIRNAQGGFIWDFVDQSIWMPTVMPPDTYSATSDKPVITA
ncbi:MAG: hypothetical protein LBU77_00595, partial [Clostridiales bacterium]|nr:hypothetical protein [Clostridiales bacterium]